MQKGQIGVASENLFPIIKKFLYSEHDIFLREIVSNAVDATQKLVTLSKRGEAKDVDLDNLKVSVSFDKKKKTITVSDMGIGMSAEEIEKYINQIAFSGANDFLDKYKDDAHAIIGHFGLGFYSSFMVSDKVEIYTKSHREGSQAVKWECDGSPEYTIENIEKDSVGTDIVMYLNSESEEFLDESKISDILSRYCRFLPIPIAFGKKKEWKDGKEVETEELNQINDTNPAWVRKPADLKEEDYKEFYNKLYPYSEEPLFNIHLNVDYPFNLTGILYFPKLKNNVEVQRNKIQLYCNQVFVTDSVEGIVPEFLTLLHGVIDSPDIPLNVSRSYLQGDANVKKISGHITKKVADRLFDIFKEDRSKFEERWDDLKIFIEYGMLSDEKFNERAKKFFLYHNIDDKYFTTEEYKTLIETEQTDKDGNVVYLYATDKDAQYSFIQAAKNKGYDVLLMDDMLATPLINKLEQEDSKQRFVRVDSDVADRLIVKEEAKDEMSYEEKNAITPIFQGVCPKEVGNFIIDIKAMGETELPVVVTNNEFMRRMKDMSQFQGGGMNFYGAMGDSYNLVVNSSHPLVKKIFTKRDETIGAEIETLSTNIQTLKDEISVLEKAKGDKKPEDIPAEEKAKMEELNEQLRGDEQSMRTKLETFGAETPLAKQLIDLALLSGGLLKGEALDRFVKRSVELIED
ncbi:MAG: molecular chaperone HtpG [Bacteroidales bacterium]